jgi:7,8-dihydroneopterin aldolase/epimerase/oxygenase
MGEIRVNDIKVYAYHGCLEEEAIIGSDYVVNLKLWASLETSCVTDELNDTLDYVTATTVVTTAMAQRSRLLEHVAKRILKELFQVFKALEKAEVCVEKLNPPIGAHVHSVSVTLCQARP